METLSTFLTLCEGNPTVADGFPAQEDQLYRTWMFSLLVDWMTIFEQTGGLPVIRDTEVLMWRHCNVVIKGIRSWVSDKSKYTQGPLLLTWINFNPSMDM